MSVFTTKYFTNADYLVDDRVKNYTSEDFDEMTNLQNWISDKVKTDLTSTYTSTDYEGMTNLKNWVVSKIPSGSSSSSSSSSSSIKVPVDICICAAGDTAGFIPHFYPLRITPYYVEPTDTISSTAIYVAFMDRSNSTNGNYFKGIYIVFANAGTKISDIAGYNESKFSGAKFYRSSVTVNTNYPARFATIQLIFNDGSRASTSQKLGNYQGITGLYIYNSNESFSFDALVNNVLSREFVDVDPISTFTIGSLTDTAPGADFVINLDGSEGSLIEKQTLTVNKYSGVLFPL